MATKSKQTLVTPELAPPEPELRTVSLVGMERTPKGYVVLAVKVQGNRVIDTEVLSDGAVPKTHADDVLRVEVVKRFIFNKDMLAE